MLLKVTITRKVREDSGIFFLEAWLSGGTGGYSLSRKWSLQNQANNFGKNPTMDEVGGGSIISPSHYVLEDWSFALKPDHSI